MGPQQLEAMVLAAVDSLRSGAAVEDDRLELKREWPSMEKARQLAGVANRARGQDVVYVIGMDESGRVHPTGDTDPAKWWAEMAARFDQVPPDLVRHLVVYVGPGESVVALQFDTTRAPYLVQVGTSEFLEVPIRQGTRTRSARRDEILRMLIPATSAPPAEIIEGSASIQWTAPSDEFSDDRAERMHMSGVVRVFVEHTGPGTLFLPAHRLEADLRGDDLELPVRVQLPHRSSKDAPPPPRTGVELRHDGVALLGPGAFLVHFSAEPDPGLRKTMRAVREWRLRLQIDVVGAARPLIVEASLRRDRDARRDRTPAYEIVGRWVVDQTSQPAS